ncbi:Chitinase [uncultured Candidatus Thioglobus sp.]|nr:Chitinase [uncultured Candidatus Thioglobus sp.]
MNIANDSRSYNIGTRWATSSVKFSLIGLRKQSADSVELRGDFEF